MILELIQSVPLYDGKKVTIEEYMNLPDDGFRYDMRAYDLGRKADRYLSNGVREFWIIDTDAKSVLSSTKKP